MVQRLTYRRKHAYNTKSNKQRVVKTPGTLALAGDGGVHASMRTTARPD